MTIDKKAFAKTILGAERNRDNAAIYDALANPDAQFTTEIFPLDEAATTANPKALNYPISALYVASATDANVEVQFRPNQNRGAAGYCPLTLKDSMNFESPVAKGTLTWAAQAGKSITIIFFFNAEFRSGSYVSSTQGGVTITDGTAIGSITQVVLAGTTATIIAPADATRKKTTLQNKTGADLYIGGANIGAVGSAAEGIKVAADSIFYWSNTSALYGWSVGGGNVHYVTES